jgi:RNA polymerase sigma-70 factor, ECF subfamily
VSADDDRADVERVLAGDPTAFEGIVRRWQGPLVNLAYRFCRDRGRAEDMAQEAFLRAFRALPSWRREAAFSTWLFSLATNLYCSEIRHIPANDSTVGQALDLADRAAIDGGLERRERDRAIRLAVQRLPARYREAMILFYFHEQDIPKVASGLGVPIGTVKARLSRGRDMLRKKLQATFDRPEKESRP